MTKWFGDYSLARGETQRWRMGPKTMWVSHAEREWRVATSEGDDPLEPELEIAQPDLEPTGEGLRLFRFVAPAGDGFRILPALPDRPIIVRSDDPVLILPGSEVSFYISCPLWVQVWFSRATQPAIDAPIFRPSDTWFGSDTTKGELCYASRTSARQGFDSLPIRHHRAVSEVQIRNRASTALQLQQLKLPAPQLSLFATESGALWTERLTFDRDDKASGAQAEMTNHPPTGLELSPLNRPRRTLRKGFLVDAFGGLWS